MTLRVRCAMHKLDLDEGQRCEKCADMDREAYAEMQKKYGQITVSMYPGWMHGAKPVLVGDSDEPVRYRHDTTSLECTVPTALEADLSEAIDKAVAEHAKKCMCYTCQQERHK